ncbi:MAG: sigma-70 family RNA polymerase sigma factor [Bacteroidetes bacterium]|nr:sigma-70 family RNA polymerase sigma factor [Bacteroidota bacterium]
MIEACRQGDRAAFNQLVQMYQEKVFVVVQRMVDNTDDAYDITQEAFVRAYEGISGFRGESQLFTWLYRIAVNMSLNHLRKKRLRGFLRLEDGHQAVAAGDPSPAADAEATELRNLVETAIEMLPAKQKAVFVLRYYDEMPYEEISTILGTSTGGLKANYHHAMKKIETYVKAHL